MSALSGALAQVCSEGRSLVKWCAARSYLLSDLEEPRCVILVSPRGTSLGYEPRAR